MFYKFRNNDAEKSKSKGEKILLTTKVLLLIAISLVAAVPFCWMTCASVKTRQDVENPGFVPEKVQLQNYTAVLGVEPPAGLNNKLPINFKKWYFNSIFVTSWVTFLQLVTSAMAAYAFSRIQWPGRDKVFLMYLGTMMIPGVVLMIPNYFIMFKLHLVNSYAGLILPVAFSAFGTFLLRQFMLTIPSSLDEAAKIDGASHWQIFSEIITPLARPGLITLAIFTFLGNYKSFFWPLVMVKDEYLKTLPIGMMYFENMYGRQTELLMAATVMNIVPLVIFFVIVQKFLVSGIQLGAVKG